MNKIILTGVRNLLTEEKLLPQIDYRISLLAERISEEKMDTFSDSETEQTKYKLKVSLIENIEELCSKEKIEIKRERSASQKWRYIVENELGEYDNFMNWQLSNPQKIFDLYKEQINESKTQSI